MANICKNVFSLAKPETGKFILPLAKNSLKPDIKISLVSIMIAAMTSKLFIVPFITRRIKAVATIILSAIGSRVHLI